MKKLYLSLAALVVAGTLFGQTLFTYGNHAVSADEFLKAFQKNQLSPNPSEEALKNYLDLYVIFKLKVQAARDLQMDTLPAQIAEVKRFRNQIEENYLWDQPTVDYLLAEASERSKKDILVHAIKLEFTSANQDKATGIADSIYHALTSGKMKWDDANSQKSQVVKLSEENLGYITVYTLPYAIENIIYQMKPRGISKPIQAGNAFYIFHRAGERPAVGKIQLAHILLAWPGPGDKVRLETKSLADSLYNLLANGADFSELAKAFSNDRSTSMTGGKMAEFGAGKYAPEFEAHAFALQKDGEITKPFASEFGYHILKRISASPVPLHPDDMYKYQFKQRLFRDERIQQAQDVLIASIKPKLGFKMQPFGMDALWKITDTLLLANKHITAGNLNYESVLFTFGDGRETGISDWDYFIRHTAVPGTGLHAYYQEQWPRFVNLKILENYKTHLEALNPEFARQIKDFIDGNMLFELMQKKVWSKATNDTAALKQYFAANKEKYIWDKSADIVNFSCADSSMAAQCIADLQSGKAWKKVLALHTSSVQADSGRIEFSQIGTFEERTPQAATITAIIVNPQDGTSGFSKIIRVYPAGGQKGFDKAKGLVINDYQQTLEQQWISDLKKKYPVHIHQRIVKRLVNQLVRN